MPGRMRVVSIPKFVKETEEVHWLIEGILPNVGWTLFYGIRGVGKTRFVLSLCASLQSGEPFIGLTTRKTRTMYIQADSPPIEFREIIKSVSPEAQGMVMVDIPRFALGKPEYVDHMRAMVVKHKPEFIVFDSLYNLAEKDINGIRILDDIELLNQIASSAGDIPWLLIHHPPHEGTRASGSNSIGANCSNDWMLLRNALKINKGRLVPEQTIPIRMVDGKWTEVKSKKSTSSSYDEIMNYKFT